MLGVNVKEVYRIKNIDDLKALSDPLRVNILLTIGKEPKSGQEISKLMNEKGSKIYYHLNELEKRGFIEIVKTEVINGIVQKFYLPVAKAFIPDLNIFSQLPNKKSKLFKVKEEDYSAFEKELDNLVNKYHTDEGSHQINIFEF